MEPLVSVGVLSMNHEEYVEQCLKSIQQQTHKNIEVIYLDNNSTDKSFERAQQFLEKSGLPFRCYKREQNFITSANFNFLLNHAYADYLCMISSDDWMVPENISQKLSRMQIDNTVAYVYSQAYTYYEDTKEIEATLPATLCLEGNIFDELLLNNFVTAPGSLVHVQKAKSIGGFREDLIIEDWDLLLRLSQQFKIAFVPEYLVYYRRHSHNTSSVFSDKYIQNKLAIVEQYRYHKNYNQSRETVIRNWLYNLIQSRPDSTTFKKLIQNFKPNRFYFKQLLKWVLLNAKRLLYHRSTSTQP